MLVGRHVGHNQLQVVAADLGHLQHLRLQEQAAGLQEQPAGRGRAQHCPGGRVGGEGGAEAGGAHAGRGGEQGEDQSYSADLRAVRGDQLHGVGRTQLQEGAADLVHVH